MKGKKKKRAAFLSVAVLVAVCTACGKTVTEPAGEILAESGQEHKSPEMPSQEERETEIMTGPQGVVEEEEEPPEKDFQYGIVKVREYDEKERKGETIYRHDEISEMLENASFGAINNREGFVYGPYLQPGERSNVRYSVENTGEFLENGEEVCLYEEMEFECFSFPELGIRSICLPAGLHADLPPVMPKREVITVEKYGREEFEKEKGFRAESTPVAVPVISADRAFSLYGEDWERKIWEDGRLPGYLSGEEYVMGSDPGIYSRENMDFKLSISSRRTSLDLSPAVLYAMDSREILNGLYAWGTDTLMPSGTDNVKILEKDGYTYVYIYTLMEGDGAHIAEGWLSRVKDGISQCVHFGMYTEDDRSCQKILDYVLNYSLEFYDMDLISYDEGNMVSYGEALTTYQEGNGEDPGNGGYWLCEKFYGN